jgi:hypothetical protein
MLSLLQSPRGCQYRQFLRNQVVASVTISDLLDVSGAAKFKNVLYQ